MRLLLGFRYEINQRKQPQVSGIFLISNAITFFRAAAVMEPRSERNLLRTAAGDATVKQLTLNARPNLNRNLASNLLHQGYEAENLCQIAPSRLDYIRG